MIIMPRRWIASGYLLLLVLVRCNAAWSAEVVPSGYRAIAAEYGIPHTLFYAVALTESGRRLEPAGIHRPWPWTLNVSGKGYFYASRDAAWQALHEVIGGGEPSVDIGLMQVNWRYHQEKLGNPWQALDPYRNLRVAAGILQQCFADHQDWWASVGCYHAPGNASRAKAYRQRVLEHWRRIMATG